MLAAWTIRLTSASASASASELLGPRLLADEATLVELTSAAGGRVDCAARGAAAYRWIDERGRPLVPVPGLR